VEQPLTDLVDHWPCRFIAQNPQAEITDGDILQLLARISDHYTWMHIEKLQRFDGVEGFTKAQGER
jgi:isocitrate dehydrogenase